MLAATCSSANRGHVSRVRPAGGARPGGRVVQRLGAVEGVERLADAAVAEAVDVHLEALVEGTDDAAAARPGRRRRAPCWSSRARDRSR